MLILKNAENCKEENSSITLQFSYITLKNSIYFHPVFMHIFTQAPIGENTIYAALHLGLSHENFPILITFNTCIIF